MNTESRANNSTDVAGMVGDISRALEVAISNLRSVNSKTTMLSLNARIESGRAGDQGAAFGVVAEEMQDLAYRTADIADEMALKTREKTTELIGLIDTAIRGTRLSDLALVNIDLVDRNLYERTCDVRWWATESSLVNALTTNDSDAITFAKKRMRVILNTFSVYHDLVLCDLSGTIVASGKADQYRSVGQSVRHANWFSQALRSSSGNQFGFQPACHSKLVNDQPSIVFSCAVRENGEETAPVLGVLGVVFNWEGLAEPILHSIPLEPKEKEATEAYIIDTDGQILASNRTNGLGERLDFPNVSDVFRSKKDFFQTTHRGSNACVGFAQAPGFEGYSTGWYSVIIQPTR